MSLVNDVLRQLDNASAKPYQGMPLHSLVVDKSENNYSFIRIFFVVLIISLSVIIMFQIVYKQSLIDIFYFDKEENQILPRQDLALENLEVGAVPQKILVADDVTSKVVLGELKEEEKEKEFIGNNTIENDSAKNSTIDNQSTENSTVKNNPDENDAVEHIDVNNETIKNDEIVQSAIINTVEKMGFKQYQLALQAYKQKHSERALSWINLALREEEREEYLRLKVRILIQQNDGDELRRLALEQSSHTSLSWFELIAPSLQMYSYHELSNKYYSELIRQQPKEVKWQLAMALNYTKLGLKDDAYSIYKNLLTSSLLTYKQTRWIASRLESIQEGEVAINDR